MKLCHSKFNSSQKHQLDLAQKFCSKAVPVLEQHPEWSSIFMNMVWNKIKNDENYKDLIRFGEMTTVVSDDEENGLLGSFHILMCYSFLEEHEFINLSCDYLKNHKNTSANALLHYVLCFDLPVNARLKLTDDIINNENLYFAIMSDGNDVVRDILHLLVLQSGYIDKESAELCKSEYVFGGHRIPGNMNILSLDDMNMRGQQIIYAYEYCDNDMATFVHKIKSRDLEMVNYVNYKSVETAKKFGQSFVHTAVAYGGSFDDFRNPLLHECFIYSHQFDEVKTVKSLQIDYAERDIYSGTSAEDAIRILKANGFGIVFDRVVDNKKERQIIMHNATTGAIMNADSVKDDDFCYGGCEITVLTKRLPDNVASWHYGIECNVLRNNSNVCVNNVTYQRDLIQNYRKIISLYETVNDMSLLGYGFRGLNLPRLRSYNDMAFHKEFKHKELISAMHFENHNYEFHRLMDCILLPKALTYVVSEKRFVYSPFIKNIYEQTIKISYFFHDVNLNSLLIGVVFKLNSIPESEISKYYAAAIRVGEERIKNNEYLHHDLERLKKDKSLFYGDDKLTELFIDEYGLKPIDI